MKTCIHRLVCLFAVLACAVVQSHAQVQEWVIHHNGPGNGEDVGTDVEVDGDGNVYITGRSEGGATGLDYVTIKYSREGDQEWVQRYNGDGNGDDAASTLIVDDEGNIYVTGYSEGIGTGSDFTTIKYNSSGEEQWVARYNGLNSNFPDEALAIVLDAAGNVYVTGRSGSGGYFEWDYATVKYNTSGVQQWAVRYNGPSGDWDQSNSVAVDADGNVYVTGTHEFGEFGGTAYHDYATIKYNSSGVTEWMRTFDGAGQNWDEGVSVGLDDNGGVYVTGLSSGLGTVYDFVTLKYNTAGDLLWRRIHNTQGNPSADVPHSMIVTPNGDVFVSGATSLNVGTIKYNSAGAVQWTATYNNGNFDAGFAMDIDAAGNVVVAGVSSNGVFESGYDFVTVLYNGSGQQQWVERYNAPSNNRDEALSIAADGAGNIYVTGYTTSGSSTDLTTIRYSTQSAIECEEITDFTARCNGSGTILVRTTMHDNIAHVGQTVSFMIDDEIHEGTIVTNGTHSRAQVMVPGLGMGNHTVELVVPDGCFDPINVECQVVPRDDQAAGLADDFLPEGDELGTQLQAVTESSLLVYPNPFNPATTISFHIEQEGPVHLAVYDVLGREVAVLVDGFRTSGQYKQSFDASRLGSGVYFVRLKTPSQSVARKILLER
jgi:uncharacterized delta-60 repeat protein